MIDNKERLEKLIELIKRLELITEEIRERDIYPVSFFSQAFDIANKIQEDLQEIEIVQIELIENQAQVLSSVRPSTNTSIPDDLITDYPKPSTQPEPEAAPIHTVGSAVSIKQAEAVKNPPQLFSQEEIVAPTTVPPPVQQVQDEKKVTATSSFGRNNRIDLKKVITLNDRFLFCRVLFANNENLMNQIFSELNMEESYDTAIDYLQKRFDWNFEDKNVTDFLAILKKRFS